MISTTDIDKAKAVLTRDDLIAIPTETVYGLAGNAFSETAIKKIFLLKKRPAFNPLIVHIKSPAYLDEIAKDIPPNAIKLAEHFWPGPLTLVLKKKDCIPNSITAGKDTVAIRMPNHPLTLELLHHLDFPLAAPSANPFGSISPTCAKHVENYFGNELEVILDGGKCKKGIESTIIGFDGNSPILYRHGALAIEEIEKIIGLLRTNINSDNSPDAPGMLSRHYSPRTNLILTDNLVEQIENFKGQKIGLLVFKDEITNSEITHQEVLAQNGSMELAVSNLYNAMHLLDALNLDVLIAEKFPDEGLGKSVNDRLERASKSE